MSSITLPLTLVRWAKSPGREASAWHDTPEGRREGPPTPGAAGSPAPLQDVCPATLLEVLLDVPVAGVGVSRARNAPTRPAFTADPTILVPLVQYVASRRANQPSSLSSAWPCFAPPPSCPPAERAAERSEISGKIVFFWDRGKWTKPSRADGARFGERRRRRDRRRGVLAEAFHDGESRPERKRARGGGGRRGRPLDATGGTSYPDRRGRARARGGGRWTPLSRSSRPRRVRPPFPLPRRSSAVARSRTPHPSIADNLALLSPSFALPSRSFSGRLAPTSHFALT